MIEQKFIDWAKKQFKDINSITKEEQGDQSNSFRLFTSSGNYFLKIGKELAKEKERLEWLERKSLPVPKVIDFVQIENKDGLLLSMVEGNNLSKLCKEWSAEKVIDKLSSALKKIHNTKSDDCPFGNKEEGKVLIHGDACLPNFIFLNDALSGYVDLGDLRVDYPDIDLCAAVWSLRYNLGPGFEVDFLRKYGIKDASEKLVQRLLDDYEKMQKEWGLSQ